MQRRQHTLGNIVPATLAASAVVGFLTSFSFFVMSLSPSVVQTSMELTPTAAVVSIGESFTTTVHVSSLTPVNAFTGVVTFDPEHLSVTSIDYNTSIANLWAEEPWYKNGEGTIHFAGGTTLPSGFTGRGELITITFVTKSGGETPVKISNAQILKHDGIGTEVELAPSIDSIFTVVTSPTTPVRAIDSAITVRNPLLTGDLNSDGVVTLADLSIFFVYVTTMNKRGDLNNDGRISTTDLSILLGQM